MKLFVQSASLEQIRETAEAGLADGVVLSPVDLASEDPTAELLGRLEQITQELALPVCVPVAAIVSADIYREGRELGRVSDQVIVQVPLLEDAVTPIRRLVADGVRICATHVYSGAQAFIAAKIGALMLLVDGDDVDAHGRHSADLVGDIRAVLDRAAVECDLAVAPAGNSVLFTDYLLAGADTAFVTPSLLSSLMIHPLTDRGVDKFLSAISKRHKPRTL